MTHKEMGARLRVLADCRTLTVENRAELDRIANELAPPRPEPGTVVWWRYKYARGPEYKYLGIAEYRGEGIIDAGQKLREWNDIKWKPAYVAPPDTEPGTEALIDELQNRIAELEEQQLKSDEVAVKVPPVSEWPMGGEALNMYIGSDPGPVAWRIITRAEAEAREAGR